jgi:23S rRNA pseudouridine1911/1915/1917 synthase
VNTESSASKTLEHQVEDRDEGERADVVVGRRVPGMSRRMARKLGLEGRLRCLGSGEERPRRIPPSTKVRTGDRLIVELDVAPSVPELVVLRETHEILYVLKPAGIHTVAHTPEQPGCLSVWVAKSFPACVEASPDPLECGAVHRLDAETSGVVAFARTREAWQAARRAFDQERVHKQYLAHCHPARWPPTAPDDALPGWLQPDPEPFEPLAGSELVLEADGFRIRAPLGRGTTRGTMAVRLDGQRATTLVRQVKGAVDATDRVTCLLRLLSGRRHQARVHLAWAGMPIEGDRLYGEGEGGLRLHAHGLDLSAAFPSHPVVIAPEA